MIKVLIIKLSSIGDVVHTLPALAALRRGFERNGQKARIDWLVEEAASGILRGHPMLDNVIVVKNRGWAKDIKKNIKTARWLSRERYDVVIDFQGLAKSAVWVLVSRGKRRIGFSNARECSSIFLNEKLPPYDPERHAVDRYMDLARYATGGDVEKPVFHMAESGDALTTVKGKLKALGIPEGSPYFIVCPSARWATKLWSDSSFVQLARTAIGSTGMYAVLVGGASDRPRLERMQRDIGDKAVNMAGATGLAELAALSKGARFAVTVDSGPMHVAAAVGTRVVALFGPTSPTRTGPYPCEGGHIVIRRGLACSPCFRRTCADPVCMSGITVDEVMKAVNGCL
ncbi:MAG: glycosyltransferase family 9 protein [Deltaproteobacteria bacterium]|nr:glycosyltransferase family 9 protein [Deltaproteobacteria bacterium]